MAESSSTSLSSSSKYIVSSLSSLFQHFPYEHDTREPQYFFQVPYVGMFGITPLDLGFWLSTFVLLSLQTLLNGVVAFITYHYIVKSTSTTNRLLMGYGILLPILLIAPIYVASMWLNCPNIALLLCVCGTMPTLLALRLTEAIHDMLPSFIVPCQPNNHNEKTEGNASTRTTTTTARAIENDDDDGSTLANLILYYSAPLKILFDPMTKKPVPFTRSILWIKLSNFISVFVQTSLLFSILLPLDFELFPRRTIESFTDLYCWGNLANSFLMASLLSLVLDGGASGLGLLTSIITGYTLDKFCDAPLTRSTSPSDFWGQRWDRPVESALRRGCFRPLRYRGGLSRNMAALGTFLVSGLIHEYILWFMALGRKGIPSNPQGVPYQPKMGNQFCFFLWNAVVLLLERLVSDHWSIKWMQANLPKPIRTALVLLTVLPIAHWFTDEYIRSCFFNDASWAFPRIVYLGNQGTS